ncbi:class II aldolase/adducin family protein [Pseudonocardia endophytica]|uniref:Ribulose-5-phosphate 4-epimerase/fuculose-1-phosphate aldolase n=1 Tax=Pseudonocardia endophytica TaxID=401976 RepID=A0A4R1HKC9_PSEEN|nr:class II aldolase/adducin family protein [Pseudonocardia endophytica]TCK22854.1 ribulose-5-phosphate 4-epimerase/fuculose-1-phosphate aldolase [Pseudonocardia endophytica]
MAAPTAPRPDSADTMSEFEPTQEGIALPRPPEFATSAEERLHRKQQLAGAFRIFGRFGFGEGVAGHITVRDPEDEHLFWVNPFGMSFRHIRVSDLIAVDHDGVVRHGNKPVNRAGFVIHSEVHKARPDVVAACHAHSVHGKSWSSLGRTLDPITQDACALYGNHVVVSEGAGAVVVDQEAGRLLAKGLGEAKMAFHQNHGIFTVGDTVAEAAWWFISTERNCQAQLMAEAAGTPTLINPENAEFTRRQTGNAFAGWFAFQPLWDEVVRTDPDLFD